MIKSYCVQILHDFSDGLFFKMFYCKYYIEIVYNHIPVSNDALTLAFVSIFGDNLDR